MGEDIAPSALCPLIETNGMWSALVRSYRSAGGVLHFSSSKSLRAFTPVDCFATRVPTQEGLLLSRREDHCGAVRIDLSAATRRAGMVLDYNGDDIDRNYELTVSGEAWPAQLRDCEAEIASGGGHD